MPTADDIVLVYAARENLDQVRAVLGDIRSTWIPTADAPPCIAWGASQFDGMDAVRRFPEFYRARLAQNG